MGPREMLDRAEVENKWNLTHPHEEFPIAASDTADMADGPGCADYVDNL